MREYIFRGISLKTSKFVLGDLVKHEGKTYMADLSYPVVYFLHEVKPETVGQYTGLQDDSGDWIFEGDILKLKDISNNYEWKAIVEFGNTDCSNTLGYKLSPMGGRCSMNTDILLWVETGLEDIQCEIIGDVYTYKAVK